MRSRTAYPILLNPGIVAKVGLKRPFLPLISRGWNGFTRIENGRCCHHWNNYTRFTRMRGQMRRVVSLPMQS